MKRGFLLSKVLLEVVAVAAVTVMLVYFSVQVAENLKEEAPVEACRLSVGAAAWAKDQSAALVDIGVSCPRDTILMNDFDPDWLSVTVADEMYLCAERFHHGRLDFARMDWLFAQERATCLICAQLQMDRATEENWKAQEETLVQKWARQPSREHQVSWQQHFTRANEEADTRLDTVRYVYPEYFGSTFDPGEEYSIVFAHVPKETWISSWRDTVMEWGRFGDFVDAVYRWRHGDIPDEARNVVMLLPTEVAIENVCNTLIN